jgi:uncharacterized membrane protein
VRHATLPVGGCLLVLTMAVCILMVGIYDVTLLVPIGVILHMIHGLGRTSAVDQLQRSNTGVLVGLRRDC